MPDYFLSEGRQVNFGYSSYSYSATNGSFAVAVGGDRDGHGCSPGSWYTCREEFHGINQRSRRILFVCGENKSRLVAAFINKIERMLEIPQERRSLFAYTGRKRIVWVQTSTWWHKYSIRRSLFTILLRAGRDYNKQNFDTVLQSATYLSNTQHAVQRFLKGYTKCTKRTVGWHHTFYHRGYYEMSRPPTQKEARELLVKP